MVIVFLGLVFIKHWRRCDTSRIRRSVRVAAATSAARARAAFVSRAAPRHLHLKRLNASQKLRTLFATFNRRSSAYERSPDDVIESPLRDLEQLG
jgi:hypothetical protein